MSEAICGVERISPSPSAPKGLNRFAVLSREVTIPYHGFYPRLLILKPGGFSCGTHHRKIKGTYAAEFLNPSSFYDEPNKPKMKLKRIIPNK